MKNSASTGVCVRPLTLVTIVASAMSTQSASVFGANITTTNCCNEYGNISKTVLLVLLIDYSVVTY